MDKVTRHCPQTTTFWGFTGKQGATTIHEDSAAYTVSTSSLTMAVEAVTHALRWIVSRDDSRTTHVLILTDSMRLLQKVKGGMGSPEGAGIAQWLEHRTRD